MNIIKNHCLSILQNVPAGRLLALDVLRGITITAMILVNNPGSWQHIYPPLAHAKWHGWTLTDLIFPFFIFIVGVSISLSGQRQQAQKLAHTMIIRRALLRTVKLILLGWFLALFYYNFNAEDYNWVTQRLMQIRFMGVLQRIALVYFACLILWIWLSRIQLVFSMLAILVNYWLAMAFIPYQDDLGNQYVGLLDYANNLSAWFDSRLIPASHLYYASARPFAFDPEGLLSTLPAIASGLSGVLAGQWLALDERLAGNKAKWLAISGITALLLGQIWGNWFPINKALWTSSYVLLTSGMAALVLAILIYILDIKRWRLWSAPFLVFGANSIAFFMFAGIVGRLVIIFHIEEINIKAWLYQHIFQPYLGNLNGSLAYAICFLLLSYMIMLAMYRKGIFWKV